MIESMTGSRRAGQPSRVTFGRLDGSGRDNSDGDRIIVAINNGGDLIEAKYRNRLTALSTGAAGIRGAISGVARWRVEAGQLAINLGRPADKGGRLV